MENGDLKVGNHVFYRGRIYTTIGYDKANDMVEISLYMGKTISVYRNEVTRLTIEEENELIILAGLNYPNLSGNLIRMLVA